MLNELIKIQTNEEYREELAKLGYLKNSKIKKSDFRKLCKMGGRQVFMNGLKHKTIKNFVLKNNIDIYNKNHYIKIPYIKK